MAKEFDLKKTIKVAKLPLKMIMSLFFRRKQENYLGLMKPVMFLLEDSWKGILKWLKSL